MGLGALLLVIGGLGLTAKRRDGGGGLTKPLLIVAALAYLWALSNVVTIGTWRVELPLPEGLIIFWRISARRGVSSGSWSMPCCSSPSRA